MYPGDFLNSVDDWLGRMTITQCRTVIARIARGRTESGRDAFLDMLREVTEISNSQTETADVPVSGESSRNRKLFQQRIDNLMKEVRHFVKLAESGAFIEDEDEEGWDSDEDWMYDDDGLECEDEDDEDDDEDDEEEEEGDEDDDEKMSHACVFSGKAAAVGEDDENRLWSAHGADVQHEVLVMLRRAESLAFEGFEEASAEVFTLLMSALACDDVQFSYGKKLEKALEEVAPLHLHLLVVLHEPMEAARIVRTTMTSHTQLVGWSKLGLDAIRGSGRMSPGQWKLFLDAFLVHLSGLEDAASGRLYREALLLRDGMDALIAHIHSLGVQSPEAWRETLTVMRMRRESDTRVGDYCLEMLSVHGLPTEDPFSGLQGPYVSAKLLPAARELIVLGAGTPAWHSIGLRAQVDIDPSPRHIAAWMHEEQLNGRSIQEMARRMLQHPLFQQREDSSDQTFPKGAASTIRKFLHMLSLGPMDLQRMVKVPKPYGWSEGNEASFHYAWTLVFLMVQRFPDKTLQQILSNHSCIMYFWDAMTNAFCGTTTLPCQSDHLFDERGYASGESADIAAMKEMQNRQLENMLFEAMRLHLEDPDISEMMEDWLKKTMLARVDFILQNKHRRAYDRVARACVACAALMTERHGATAGKTLLESVRKERARFSAFAKALREEAAACAKGSGSSRY